MKIKDKKGSISIFVLVGLFFMASFLLISYASNVNRSKIAKEQFNVIQGIYAYNGEDEGAYEKSYTDLRQKNKQIREYDSSDEELTSVSTVELEKTFLSDLEGYKIYGNSDKPERLPEEYQEVEWIGTDGNSYLISKFNINNLDKFTIYYRYNTNGTSANKMWGASSPEESDKGRFLHRYTNIMKNNLTETGVDGLPIPVSNNWESIVIVADNNNKTISCYNDGVLYMNTLTWENKKNLDDFGILCNNYDENPGDNIANSGSKIAELRFVNDDTGEDVFNPIPCYRKSDNSIGMYDLVSKEFYMNKGTGTFTKGANVESEGVGDVVNLFDVSSIGAFKNHSDDGSLETVEGVYSIIKENGKNVGITSLIGSSETSATVVGTCLFECNLTDTVLEPGRYTLSTLAKAAADSATTVFNLGLYGIKGDATTDYFISPGATDLGSTEKEERITFTFTIEEEFTIEGLRLQARGGTGAKIEFREIQLEESAEFTEYTDYGTYRIKIKAGNSEKNLLDYTKAKDRSGNTNTLEFISDGVLWKDNVKYWLRIPCEIPAGTRVVFSCKSKKELADGTTTFNEDVISQFHALYSDGTYEEFDSNIAVTLPKDVVEIRPTKNGQSTDESGKAVIEITNMQVEIVEEGLTDDEIKALYPTEYEAHKAPTYINIYVPGGQLRKYGGVSDYIIYEKNNEVVTQKLVRNLGYDSNGSLIKLGEAIETEIELPAIPVYEDFGRLEFLTTILPSRVELKYWGYTLEGN